MSPFLSIVVVRGIIALAGVMCIHCGYRLFYVATEKQGQLSIQLGEKKQLTIGDVAPGTFFALFGAAILIASLVDPMYYSSTEGVDPGVSLGRSDGARPNSAPSVKKEEMYGGRSPRE